jgi:hypothetical protein
MRAWIDSSAARGIESCRPAHAARRSDFVPAARRSSSEPTRRRKRRICDRDSSSGGVLRSISILLGFVCPRASNQKDTEVNESKVLKPSLSPAV